MSSFDEQLARARERLARAVAAGAGFWDLPPHLRDQHDAASRQLRAHLEGLFGSDVFERDVDTPEEQEALARLLVAQERCTPCSHLVRQPLQPQWATLALRRRSCERCAAIDRETPLPPEASDTCGYCRVSDVTDLEGLLLSRGRTVWWGGACPSCFAALHPEPEGNCP